MPSTFVLHAVVDILEFLFEIFVELGFSVTAVRHFLTDFPVQSLDDQAEGVFAARQLTGNYSGTGFHSLPPGLQPRGKIGRRPRLRLGRFTAFLL